MDIGNAASVDGIIPEADSRRVINGVYYNTENNRSKKIEEYIRNQLQEDLEYDQMTLKEYIDPFTGEPVNKGR